MNAPSTFPEAPTEQSGIALSCRPVGEQERAELPWLPETLWSAIHPNGSNYLMGVGGTPEEARAMLVRNFPELGSLAA
jgi:hypothetical protein